MDEHFQKGKKKKIAFIGLGRVGSALATLSQRAGYEFIGGLSKDKEKAAKALKKIGAGRILSLEETLDADIIFITVNDENIEPMAKKLSALGRNLKGKTFAHCSGFYDSSLLASLSERGASVGSFHPVFPFVSFKFSVDNLPGSYAVVEGPAAQELIEFGENLGMKVFRIESSAKPLHHIACVYASGLMLALLSCSEEIAEKIRLPFETYLDLAEKALKGAKNLPLREAITGPWRRKDSSTIEAHLKITPFPEIYKALLEVIYRKFQG